MRGSLTVSKEYIPLFLDFNEMTVDLSDEECGRLIRAIIDYANNDEYEHRLIGQEKIAFRFLKGAVDRNQAISEVRARAGSNKKDHDTTNDNKPEQNGTNENKPEQTKTNSVNNNKNKNKNENDNRAREDDAMISDSEATKIMNEHDTVLSAAETAGFPRTDAIRAKLISLYAEHGLEKMLNAITSCVEYGVVTIAYLKGVLKGEPKRPKKQPGKTVIAQQYEQRDYATDPDYKRWEEEQQRDLERRIAEMDKQKELALSG